MKNSSGGQRSVVADNIHRGKVFLVGAGPGDPKLITVRGLELLRVADAVLYDRLIHVDLLKETRTGAELIYVGKEYGETGSRLQDSINELMMVLAREGKSVVRLKGGDPFVFGRGGEEALYLAENKIPFEVVPGVSAAIAVAESALIPVTHRGVSAGFGVFSGHSASGEDEIDWQVAAQIPTAVFLMGVKKLPFIVTKLREFGRAEDTPVAVVQSGTLLEQRVVTGTLVTIVELAKGLQAPATVIVGEVVAVRERLQLTDLISANPTTSVI